MSNSLNNPTIARNPTRRTSIFTLVTIERSNIHRPPNRSIGVMSARGATSGRISKPSASVKRRAVGRSVTGRSMDETPHVAGESSHRRRRKMAARQVPLPTFHVARSNDGMQTCETYETCGPFVFAGTSSASSQLQTNDQPFTQCITAERVRG